MRLTRRAWLAGAASSRFAAARPRAYRAVLIGATSRGGYGHDWDLAWNGTGRVTVTAVADPDEAGRKRAMERSGAARGYADYREMISREKPDLATICPRWLDQRVAMFTAAAQAGAHILMEKPFAASLRDADLMVATAERYGVKVQVGHTARAAAVTARVRDLLGGGSLGDLLEVRARGKEDGRAGGEDLMVLGTHTFDLMRYFAGNPEWVFAHVSERGRDLTGTMMHSAGEPVGLVGGDQVAAMFCFPSSLHAYFGSKPGQDQSGRRFGITLYGSRGVIFVPLFDVPSSPAYLLRNPAWVGDEGHRWERIDYPAGTAVSTRGAINQIMALDLLDAIEQDREPLCGARDGRWTVEMVAGVYQSQFARRPVDFPLTNR